MVEVSIDSVRVSLTNQQRIVLLRDADQERFLPIWIGPFEAEAITISLQEIEVARPQTHDLLIQALEKMGARLIRVEIIELKGDIFYGNLVVEQNEVTYEIDARPSDSIALAVRAHVPILVNSEIMRDAAITPDDDIQTTLLDGGETGSEPGENEPDREETRKRLSLFEDFLKNVDLGDTSGGEDNSDSPPPDETDQPDDDEKPTP